MKRFIIFAQTYLILTALPLASSWSGVKLKNKTRYLLGVDFPWLNYGNDFGKNSWGAYGVSTQVSTINPQFAQLKNASGNTARWWLFADGRAGITTNSSGAPIGLDSKVFADLDAAAAIAKNNSISLNMVLFDFSIVFKPTTTNGVTMGGKYAWLTTQLDALMNNVIIPVLKRYGNNTGIFSWEIMNEPEWIISDIKYPAVNSNAVSLNQSQFFTFAKRVADAVRNYTNQYVTIGSACLKWYRIWTPAYAKQKGLPNVNLTFYQTHYYPWMNGYSITNDTDLGTMNFSPTVQNVSALKDLDKPIIVGEYEQSGVWEFGQFLSLGYAGAWPWSVYSDYPVYYDAFSSWAKNNSYCL